MIWTFKQERNCCTISVCYSGCEMTPRRDSFARRQPPIQPVLDASFLLMQRSGTHALLVKLTGSHLPVLRVRSFVLIVLCRGEKIKQKSIFFIDSRNFFRCRPKLEKSAPPTGTHRPPRAIRPETPRGRFQTAQIPHRSYSCRSRKQENAASNSLSIIRTPHYLFSLYYNIIFIK